MTDLSVLFTEKCCDSNDDMVEISEVMAELKSVIDVGFVILYISIFIIT